MIHRTHTEIPLRVTNSKLLNSGDTCDEVWRVGLNEIFMSNQTITYIVGKVLNEIYISGSFQTLKKMNDKELESWMGVYPLTMFLQEFKVEDMGWWIMHFCYIIASASLSTTSCCLIRNTACTFRESEFVSLYCFRPGSIHSLIHHWNKHIVFIFKNLQRNHFNST